MADKPHMNLVFIGHVDHGKSTLVGRTLFETGEIPDHVIEEYKKEAEEKGKGTFAYAWAMDQLDEERDRGLTIDVMHKRFDTDKYYFTIIDAPGHQDFVKNMITGTSQADAAVLVVAAPEGVMAQTREHTFLAKTLGVDQLVVAINKMDATKPEFSEDRFNEVKDEVTKLLKSVGYQDSQFNVIPTSALKGHNITREGEHQIDWWDGEKFLESINGFEVPEKPIDKPLRLPIQDVYSITGIGTVPVGRIETGVMEPGDKVTFMPANATGEVKSIEEHHEEIPKAEPGDNVGFNVRGVGKDDIRRGDVCGPANDPPTVAETFTARIIVLDHPSVVTEGYTPVFHTHTAQVACKFMELQKKLDAKTGEVKEENPDFLKNGEAAVVKVMPTRNLSIERVEEFSELGRFAIRDMGQTVAAGQVIDIEEKEM
ncbi:MAG: translation elongation factor EF-1 subunit alpha [Candidatus Thermoplasmatota archaeon]|nr:translation elongation factor EF-1 subunit alpha [Candidatus Thermoplasmatota archaeon]MBS3789684.1 translation elongation factor EF-1 subunit alpha [Candidatus Thermoplasmatota archaeon]